MNPRRRLWLKNLHRGKRTTAETLSSDHMAPPLKYGEKKTITGAKFNILLEFKLYLTFKLLTKKKGKSRYKCKFINLAIISLLKIFFNEIRYIIKMGECGIGSLS